MDLGSEKFFILFCIGEMLIFSNLSELKERGLEEQLFDHMVSDS